MKTKNTKGFLILDESTFKIVKGKQKDGLIRPLFFKDGRKADAFAAGMLEIWQIVPVDFHHKFINHKTNM